MEFVDPINLQTRELFFKIITSRGRGVPIEGRYALDYIDRAKEIVVALQEGQNEGHALADALLNCKNAIDYQIDVILYSVGLEIKGKPKFPEKIEVLQQIGVVAPSILSKINKIRNKIAHEYYLPSKDEVVNAIDVAELFYYSTNRLSKLFIDSMTVTKDNEELFSITHRETEIVIEIELENLKQKDLDDSNLIAWWTTPEGPEKEALKKKRDEWFIKKHESDFITYSINMDNNPDLFFKWFAFLIRIQT